MEGGDDDDDDDDARGMVVVSNDNWPLETRLPVVEVGMRQEYGPENRALAGAAPARRTQRIVRVLGTVMDTIVYFVACERAIAPGFVRRARARAPRVLCPASPRFSLHSEFESPGT